MVKCYYKYDDNRDKWLFDRNKLIYWHWIINEKKTECEEKTWKLRCYHHFHQEKIANHNSFQLSFSCRSFAHPFRIIKWINPRNKSISLFVLRESFLCITFNRLGFMIIFHLSWEFGKDILKYWRISGSCLAECNNSIKSWK